MADPQFITFCGKVAADLGMTVDETWEPAWNGVRITDGAGRGYFLAAVRGNAARVEIRPVFGQTSYWFADGDRKPITCSRERGAEAVAADITRRLALRYETVLAAITQWDAVRQAEDTARAALASAIASVFPPGCVSFPSHLQKAGATQLIIYGPSHFGGQVRMFADADHIEIERLTVPRHVAVAMLACFADVCRPREQS